MLRAFSARFAVLTQVRQHDVVYLFREAALLGPAVIERQLARLHVPIVYDFDDPIWLAYRSPQNGVFSRLKFPGKTAAICRLATRVVTGNRLLATWARQHSSSVDVVPSTVDMEKYPAKSHDRQPDLVTLGWSGSHSTLPFLELVQETLVRLAGSRRFKLLVISHTDDYRNEGLPVPIVSKRWCAATEAMDLHEMDIGLAPFPNSGWTPWRCHGKVLQYMAAGIPCVASNIGILPDYIQDGVNGFLAASDDEWIEKLRMLIDDPDLRRRMGAAARQTIEKHYSAAVWAPRMRQIMEQARAEHAVAVR
jgi:glycosyltransferase involved in cell wall biosynthesis